MHGKTRRSIGVLNALPTVRNDLRVAMCDVYEELTRRVDPPAVLAALEAAPDGSQTQPAAALTAN